MIQFSSKYRSTQAEIMDDFQFQGGEMKNLLLDLKRINKWLGGNNITLNGISKLLAGHSKNLIITILDIGCGDGEMLRQCAIFGKKHGWKFQLIGLDANAFIMEEAKKKSKKFQNIIFQKIDVFSEEHQLPSADIVLCTLFLHHFKDTDISLLIDKICRQAKVGVVINDLQRSRLAFWLFKIIGFFFLKTHTARHDGLVSIARGFKHAELIGFSEDKNETSSTIQWKWAFRYQWMIRKK